MENLKAKEPAQILNLSTAFPNIIKYDQALLKKLAVGVVVIVMVSMFLVMSKKNLDPVKEEEQVNFEHITPKIYEKIKIKNNPVDHELLADEQLAVTPDSKISYNIYKQNATVDSAKPAEHNVSLLREYFEQQALIKIKEEDDARLAPIAFSIPVTADKFSANVNRNTNGSNALANYQSETNNSNNMGAKMLKAGSIIPCVLSTAINSDLPGVVVARVREHVFDTATGKFLLIPQGAILLGHYNNEVNFGQERVSIIFQRLDLPPNANNSNGYSIDLEQLTGADLSGHSGISDKVNNHYDKVAVGISLSSLLAAIGKGRDELYEVRDKSVYQQRAINKASENVSDIANKIADKQLKQNPTITVRAGVPFNIIVAKDLSLLPL